MVSINAANVTVNVYV